MSDSDPNGLKIVVVVKYVPSSESERRLDGQGVLDRTAGILSELDEHAIEAALQLEENAVALGTDDRVIALTMGPPEAAGAIKHCLQMGAHEGLHIVDTSLAGSDVFMTSQILAAAIKYIGDVDIVLTAMASTDSGTSAVPAQIAERLDWPQLTFVTSLALKAGRDIATATRETDVYVETLEASLPVLVSVTDQINNPRYPNFKGIMAAKSKPVQTLGLSDLEMSATGPDVSRTRVVVEKVTPRPPRKKGTIIVDEGDASVQLLDFLAKQKML